MSPIHLATLALGGLILGYQPLAAAEATPAVSFEVRGRTAFALSQPNHLQRNMIGLGFGATFATPLPGRVGVEVGYAYKPGSYYLENIQDPPSAITWVNPATGVAGPVTPNPIDRDKAASDARINYLEGVSFRLWYSDAFKALGHGWKWQAGLQIGGAQYKYEVRGDIQSQNWGIASTTTGAPKPGSWRDNYWAGKKDTSMPLSPFLGVSTEVLPDTSFEVNLFLLRYKSHDYVHATGSGTYRMVQDTATPPKNFGMLSGPNEFPADHVTSRQELAPHIEVGFAYHF